MEETKKLKVTEPALELNTTSFLPDEQHRHVYNENVICVTDSKGYPEPDNKSVTEIRVDATDGFIPLWDRGVYLHWRFNKSFDSWFKDPEAAKAYIRKLFGEAIISWKDACPIGFRENKDAWDFEISMHQKDCDSTGCVLASAFFPGQGQNTLWIYPTMLEKPREMQKETLEHELGHIFGLRHFFANIKEVQWRSELFGTDSPFSIMNYGHQSKLTDADRNDLKLLYRLVWTGKLKEINRTPIKKCSPYHMTK